MINSFEIVSSIQSSLADELDELVVYLDLDHYDFVELEEIDTSSFSQLIETKTKKRPLGELDVNSFQSSKKIKLEKSTSPENVVSSLTVEPTPDFQIWEGLTYKSNRTQVLKKKMNHQEENEFKRLSDILESQIKDLGWCTVNVRFTRTHNGYLLRNKCRLRSCRSYWGMVVNIFTNEAYIYCDTKCAHTI